MNFLLPDEPILARAERFDFLRAEISDFAKVLANDDGFLTDGMYANYILGSGDSISRFGKKEKCQNNCVRLAAEPGPLDIASFTNRKSDREGNTTVECGEYPQTILSTQLYEMAEKELADGRLQKSGRVFRMPDGSEYPEYLFNGRKIVCCTVRDDVSSGYIELSDGQCYSIGQTVFISVNPIVWFYDRHSNILLSRNILFPAYEKETMSIWLGENLAQQIVLEESKKDTVYDFKYFSHNEIELIKSFTEANIPVFIHGLSGDGKSDRVHEIDPLALDIELVNETPETMNGRVIYNEAKDEIKEIKPAWLVELERRCEDGKPHILFFDELTNATKQTQTIIFKIILDRIVNNRWKLPENARIIAAGNDRAESSVAHDLAEPLFGRFAHISIRTTVDNWMPWAMANEINPYVMEFIGNHNWLLRTEFTGKEANADPRRWEMASNILNASNNDFGLLAPVVGQEIAEEFIQFFRSQRTIATVGEYSDTEIAGMSVARKYQLTQQCLNINDSNLEETRAFVERLGKEYLSWFDYTKKAHKRIK